MENKSSIRSAELSDIPRIKTFLEKARFVHRHLDWRNPWDWITHDVFLVQEKKREKINALFSCTSELNGIHWVRLFSTKNPLNYFASWNQLFDRGIAVLREKNPNLTIFSLAYFDWMIKLLELEGWNEIERIIQFQWDIDNLDRYIKNKKHPLIRRMILDDLQDVHAIDMCGFKPVWQQSFDAISASLKQSGYATVYSENGKILGFQISTINNNRSHLARIAVHPDYRRMKIGELLVKDLLNFCLKSNIQDISVNTQQSNSCSTSLYHKLGFRDTGKSFPIFSF